MDNIIFDKYKNLVLNLNEFNRPLLALSGGLDSSFLAFAMKDAGVSGEIVTITSALFTEEEWRRAEELANQLDISFQMLDLGEKHLEKIRQNPADRCYICKRTLFKEILSYMTIKDCDIVMDGTTYDDRFKHRPGIRALDELGIRSPLDDAGLAKNEIRALCRYFNLKFSEMPSSPCLATRFPYGERLTVGKIKKVAGAERFIASLGFKKFRVRSHNGLARIEISEAELPAILNSKLMKNISVEIKKMGFDYVTLNMDGLLSGSMDI